jgi:hypothetical protein
LQISLINVNASSPVINLSSTSFIIISLLVILNC